MNLLVPHAIHISTLEVGSLAEWVSGVATVAAVGAALFANKITSKERSATQKERDEAATDRALYRRELDLSGHDRRAELARKVLLRVEGHENALNGTSDSNASEAHDSLSVTNYSDFPIFDIKLGTRETPYEVRPLARRDSLGPGETFSIEVRSVNIRRRPLVAGFLDARGRGWIIDQFGHLMVGNNRIDLIRVHDGDENTMPD